MTNAELIAELLRHDGNLPVADTNGNEVTGVSEDDEVTTMGGVKRLYIEAEF